MKTFILRIAGSGPGLPGHKVSLWVLPDGQSDPDPLVPELPIDFHLSVEDENGDVLGPDGITRKFEGTSSETSLWEKVGRALYDAVAQGQIGNQLRTAPPKSRVMLDVQDPQLQHLPWELIRRGPLYLLGDEERPWCRLWRPDLAGLGATTPLFTPSDDWPLRIMIILAAPEVAAGGAAAPDNQFIFAQEELERIQDALAERDADVDIWVIKRKTKAFVVDKIRKIRPHILHFVGHAIPAGEVGTEAALKLYDAANVPQYWPCNEIIDDLRGHTLRLAFLNACATGKVSGEAWAVSQAFLEAGVPAVISMRTDVAGKSAAVFARAFYEALAGECCLDAAVERGRREVKAAAGALTLRDWAVPCLQVSTLPEHILTIGCGIEPKQREMVENLPDFRPLRSYVDRCDERHQSWQHLIAPKPGILVFTGPTGIGKTTVTQLVLERCALQGRQVRYVDFLQLAQLRRDRAVGHLDVLRALRDGWQRQDLPQLTAKLEPQDAFKDFDAALDRRGSSPANDQHSNPDSSDAEVYRTFLGGLKTCAGTSGLVLAFDNLTEGAAEFPTEEFKKLKLLLFDPLGKEPDPKIQVILAATDGPGGDYDRYNIRNIWGMQPLSIPLLPGEQVVELFMSYISRNLLPPKDEAEAKENLATVRQVAQGFCSGPTDGIQPIWIKNLANVLLYSPTSKWRQKTW